MTSVERLHEIASDTTIEKEKQKIACELLAIREAAEAGLETPERLVVDVERMSGGEYVRGDYMAEAIRARDTAWAARVEERTRERDEEVAEAGPQGNATQPEPLRTVVESFVASIETYYTPKGAAPRLHGCLMCDPLNPWNESDTDASGPTREQFTHWPDCKIGRLKAALADRQPTPPAVAEAEKLHTLLSWVQDCVVRSAHALALAAVDRGIDGANLDETAVGVSTGLMDVDAAITKGEPPAVAGPKEGANG